MGAGKGGGGMVVGGEGWTIRIRPGFLALGGPFGSAGGSDHTLPMASSPSPKYMPSDSYTQN